MSNGLAETRGGLGRAVQFLATDNGQRLALISYSLATTAVLAALPGSILAYALGFPLMFFVPGYAVVRVFFWRGTSPEAKVVLSLGISILAMIALGLVLVLSPIGLSSDTTRASTVVFVLAMVALDVFLPRGSQLPLRKVRGPAERRSQDRPDKVVVAMLATALVISGISLGLIATAKYPSRTYFALTGEDGKVITNTTFERGTNLTVVLHMKNGEDGPRNFTLVAYVLDKPLFGTRTYSKELERGALWNQTVSFNLTELGYYRLDFDLYIQEADEPPVLYGNLHLWIGVVEGTR